ncbi:hypothetical protein [Bradyrhizobium guangdongense]|uniref:Uncharacterized protein n=1 Tax=Bradyrhizobium guangdongense TaxID=1325090 RepID=A0AA87W7I7_9BRAD|nr:hypothetical protein [Bradyrhizobium guangdongense]GGI25395.1 hypothetical protein GCM10010987_34170 [Bradyrhizobium guangdongense]
MARESTLRQRLALGLPDLTAEVYLYPADAAGRKSPVGLGWGCPCSITNKAPVDGWDGYPLLQSEMTPGERRTLGFVFLSGAEATSALTAKGKFYLWEAGVIGEANIIR